MVLLFGGTCFYKKIVDFSVIFFLQLVMHGGVCEFISRGVVMT